jgi:D-threo-aldose 1-dehydrogenase
MKNITLKGTDVKTTELGFGCAGLMQLTSKNARQKILNKAYDAGIKHFDVARMYGLGLAEAEVGRFVKGRRDQVTITTKFGIEINSKTQKLQPVINLARQAVKVMPALKKTLKKKSPNLYQKRRYDVDMARTSLEKSLNELQTDYVDIFLLHEPDLPNLQDSDLLEYLEREKGKGTIRAYGIAGYPSDSMKICQEMSGLTQILQIPNDVIKRQILPFNAFYKKPIITFSPFSAALNKIVDYVISHPDIENLWKNELEIDCSSKDTIMQLLIKYGVVTNPAGITLFSTGKPERIDKVVEAVENEKINKELIDRFSTLVQKNLEY